MDKNEALDIVRKYKEEVTKLAGASKVYMFGSYSKGCAHENSDIDVAVIVPDSNKDWFGTVKKLWKASRKVNSLIEPVLLDEEEKSPLYDEIMKSGIII